MANKQINDLQLRSDADDTCNIPVDDASQTWRVTLAQVKTYLKTALFADASVITGQTEDTSPASTDSILTYDLSATALKKVTKGNFQKKAVTSKTANYTATVEDEVILCDATSAAFTITLPAASGNTGKVLQIKKIDSTLNAVTVDGSGSETIDGSATKKCCTQYEMLTLVCDGTNWALVDRFYPKTWTSWTPTFTGLGTVSSISFWWRREGQNIRVMGQCTFGTVTATEARVSHPTGITVDSTIASGRRPSGQITYNASQGSVYRAIVDSATAYVNIGRADGSSNPLTSLNGTNLNDSMRHLFDYDFPVSGWEG